MVQGKIEKMFKPTEAGLSIRVEVDRFGSLRLKIYIKK